MSIERERIEQRVYKPINPINPMKDKIKCIHYKGKGYTYQIVDGEISICEKCEKLLRKGMADKIKIEKKLILPINKSATGQKRVTIPKNSEIDTDYVEVKPHG